MTRLSRAARGKYEMVIGSRVQVMNGTAHHTSGGLTKESFSAPKMDALSASPSILAQSARIVY